ncbi:signal recognition particle protein Srp54 [Methanosphaera sp.]|uniref:signal recognition particle protein Srp54 n=1 Tax=Methanosphaera sp. TaxID=2666342 RepID=UPI0025DB8E94|nr:signal recognition particle protein Srp54 [Methanosphaera sp.]MEE1117180.1 signal recognition particle protein Srp54 [Methanosphaera sp.]MEE3324288.1 signal recognition particle protein Srp54 [Methanosphaera sp.]MEE3418586.1 signal recognition particle protein Srp54 [Methanosphaera sp.]
MLEGLSDSLSQTMKKLAGMSIIDKQTLKEVTKDIQRALIQSDVNVKVVFALTKKIEKRALEEELPKGLSPKEHVMRIVYEELVNLVGEEPEELKITHKPFKIMMLGLQGSGKTTTTAKLVKLLKKRGHTCAIVCTDTWRPAAYEQLRQLCEPLDTPVYGDPENQDAIDLAKKGLEKFENKYDIILVDTAGRHKEEQYLLDEMKELSAVVEPDEVILVIDGTIGQQAKNQAESFKQTTDIGSIIVSKLDGSAKGGGALSAVAEIGAPIKFIGTGERVDDFEAFDPNRFISRLLGMGDLETLIEKAQEVTSEKSDKEMIDSIISGKFTLKDMENQLNMMNKMGPMQQIMKLIPGIGSQLPANASKVTEEKLERYKILMNSMTEYELENPEVIKKSRINRISRGAGLTNDDVKELLKYYSVTKKALKGMGKRNMGGPMGKLMRRMNR